MGNNPSPPSVAGHYNSRHLGAEYRCKLHSGLLAELDRNESISLSEFVCLFPEKPLAATKIFAYLSLNNPSVTATFFENRLLDLLAHHSEPQHSTTALPWPTLIDTIGLDVEAVLSITTRVQSISWTIETRSMLDLVARFPTLETQFNRSVEDFIFENDNWDRSPLVFRSSLLEISLQRVMPLLVPDLQIEKGHLLFSLAQHGASFRALAASIKFYPGAILLVARDPIGRIFGFYSKRSLWEETRDRFDETARESIIFQLSPELRFRRVNQRGGCNCVYFNVSNPNQAIGIGLGGQLSAFRFWLDGNDLSSVKSMDFDATFEPGQILSSENNQDMIQTGIVRIEVLAFGGPDALEEQRRRRAADEEVRMDRRKIDKLKLVQNEFNKEILFSKTFKDGTHQTDRLGS